MPKQTVHKSEFATLADQGIRAYQQAQGLKQIGMAEQYIAEAISVGQSTVNGWRRGRTTRRYDDLKNFAAVCLRAAPELGEQWVIDLFRAADMARYCEQALADIYGAEQAIAKPTPRSTGFAEGQRINIAGTVPALPTYYVRRRTKLKALQRLTLAQRDAGGWIAILGMTGAGKSTLMTALGHDPGIQTAFAGNVRWFEVRQTTTTHSLAQRIAQAFDQVLPEGGGTDADVVACLQRVLPNAPLLLLLDNVANPAVVAPLQALHPHVVVVVTVRAVQDAAALDVPKKAWVTIGELDPEEAWELVEHISPVEEEQSAAAQMVLQMLEYHPYITVLAACAALTFKLQWNEIGDIITTLAQRSQAERFFTSRNVNVWATLELDWERLDPQSSYALATLGRLPYFSRYDLLLAQAVWGMSTKDALFTWKILVAMQLARHAPEPDGEYTVHWLIRDFAADKAQQWSLGQRLRFAGWIWRYRLPFRLRWWRPALRKPKPDPRWPWYSFTLPGTEGRRGFRFIDAWLINTLWRQDGRQLNLRVGPVEWVAVRRLSVRFLVAILVFIGFAVVAALTLSQGNRPFVAALGMVVALWITIVTYIDTRRAAMWWGLETSLPYTAA
ncbi:MAG: NB-ARC domain-containing protein, partial [Anaerolineae bacterium]